MKLPLKKILTILPLLLCGLFSIAQNKQTENEQLKSKAKQWSKNTNSSLFIENKGQVCDMEGKARPDILFTSDNKGAKIYLRKTGLSYVLSEEIVSGSESSVSGSVSRALNCKPETVNFKLHRVDMDFIGSNPNPLIEKENSVPQYFNYYYPHCPDGITNVKAFQKINYREIYKGIDVLYHSLPIREGRGGAGLKYDIVVKPSGNPNNIKIQYTGANKLWLENNKLKIETSVGTMEEYIPKVYQNINGEIIVVNAEYNLVYSLQSAVSGSVTQQETENRKPETQIYQVGFTLGEYDHNYDLVIDPWATYFGGDGSDGIGGIAIDSNNDLLMSGVARSSNFPVTAGAFQTFHSGGTSNLDITLIKFNNNGSPIWATYYGGSGSDNLNHGIAIDLNNNLAVAGFTASTDLPVSAGCYQQVFKGVEDAFVLKFNTNGFRVWATYFGGNDYDYGSDVAIDNNNNILFCGYTKSTNFPSSIGTLKGTQDAFIVKLDASGAYVWGALFGGTGNEDWGISISCDASGNPFVTGSTPSHDFPVTAGVFQTSFSDYGANFVAKFNTAGSLSWATYCGEYPSGYSGAISIANDSKGNVIASGLTKSTNYPVTSGAFQTKLAGNVDAYLIKLDPNGLCLWSTYYGGNDYEYGFEVTTDIADNVIMCGNTKSTNLPLIAGAVQTVYGGGNDDGYFAIFSSSGNLNCGSYYGSSGYEYFHSVAADNYGHIYCVGSTDDVAFPVTANAYQTVYGGGLYGADGVICQFSPLCNMIPTPTLTISVNIVDASCSGLCNGSASVNVSGGTAPYSYLWMPGGATTSAISNLCSMSYTLTVRDVTYFSTDKKTFFINTTYTPTVMITGAATIIYGDSVLLSTSGTYAYYQWSPSAGLSCTTCQTTFSRPVLTTNYCVDVTDNSGCKGKSCVTVSLSPTIPPLTVSLNTSDISCSGLCDGSASINNVTGGFAPYSYLWMPGGATTYNISGLCNISYTLTVKDSKVSTGKNVFFINAIYTPSVMITGAATIIEGDSVLLNASAGYVNYQWSPATGLNCTTCLSAIAKPLQTTDYCVEVTDNNGCMGSSCVTINLEEKCVELFIPKAFSPDADGINDVFFVYGNCMTGVSFKIFDRWGNQLFETDDVTKGWDGSSVPDKTNYFTSLVSGQKKEYESALFVYRFDAVLKNGESVTKRGYFYLLR